jgi:hypothetical protein
MAHLTAYLISLLSFAALAHTLERQQENLYGRLLAPGPVRTMRIIGWSGLVCALAFLVSARGWGIGVVSFFGHTSAAAASVFCLLIFIDRYKVNK